MPSSVSRRYHVPVMDLGETSYEKLQEMASASLVETAIRLRSVLVELASRLQPFPGFMGMVSVQALEVDPAFRPKADRGCVVLLPTGEICLLDLGVLPGADTERGVDHVEEFLELDLPVDEYIVYATAGVNLLVEELRRRVT